MDSRKVYPVHLLDCFQTFALRTKLTKHNMDLNTLFESIFGVCATILGVAGLWLAL